MSDLIQNVTNGIIEQSKSFGNEKKAGMNALGKDAFLQLLVTPIRIHNS